MARKKFFILDYTLGDDHIPNLLLRVVGDKYDPKASYAPDGPLVNELLPNLLPKPNITTNRKDCLANIKDAGARVKLSKLFHLEVERKQEDQTAVESEQVKRYSLGNADLKFQKLMQDSRYASEVRHLLYRKRSRRAYLVIGFMTTTNATWSKTAAAGTAAGAGATAATPTILQGAAAAAGLEIVADARVRNSVGRESEWIASGEEIFAVSYMEIKLEGQGFLGAGPKVPVIGDTVVASNRHAALGGGGRENKDDSETGSESEDEDEEDRTEQAGTVALAEDEEMVIAGLDQFFEVDLEAM